MGSAYGILFGVLAFLWLLPKMRKLAEGIDGFWQQGLQNFREGLEEGREIRAKREAEAKEKTDGNEATS